jgi:hypothetical protein
MCGAWLVYIQVARAATSGLRISTSERMVRVLRDAHVSALRVQTLTKLHHMWTPVILPCILCVLVAMQILYGAIKIM